MAAAARPASGPATSSPDAPPNETACPVCRSLSSAPARSPSYRRCAGCGHERIAAAAEAGDMVNDLLSREEIERESSLDRFKDRSAQRAARRHDFLVDIGSASGKFLHRNRRRFQRVLGLEVSEASAAFARRELGLSVEGDVSMVDAPISLATAWHSLEHIPAAEIGRILDRLRARSTPETRILIAVPSADSLQYRLFGRRFAYHDHPQHLHQFSARSLELLLARHGFRPVQRFRSFPYSSFGALQGLLNLCQRTHNYLYYRKKRGWTYNRPRGELRRRDALNLLLAALLAPPALLLTAIELAFPRRAAVLTVAFAPAG